MKALTIGLLALVSFTSFAGEIATNRCQVTFDKGVAYLTNDISKEIKLENGESYEGVEGNCLDLVKEIPAIIDGEKVKEINLKYISAN